MRARVWDVRTESGLLTCYDATADAVYRYALRLARSPHVASDLLQEAFLALLRQARAGTIETVSIGWLTTTVRHRYLNMIRGDERERRRLELVATDESPAEERGGAVDLLASMSARERAAVVLRYVDGFSVRDVGEQLGLTVRATESLLARAKARVRRKEVRDG